MYFMDVTRKAELRSFLIPGFFRGIETAGCIEFRYGRRRSDFFETVGRIFPATVQAAPQNREAKKKFEMDIN